MNLTENETLVAHRKGGDSQSNGPGNGLIFTFNSRHFTHLYQLSLTFYTISGLTTDVGVILNYMFRLDTNLDNDYSYKLFKNLRTIAVVCIITVFYNSMYIFLVIVDVLRTYGFLWDNCSWTNDNWYHLATYSEFLLRNIDNSPFFRCTFIVY